MATASSIHLSTIALALSGFLASGTLPVMAERGGHSQAPGAVSTITQKDVGEVRRQARAALRKAPAPAEIRKKVKEPGLRKAVLDLREAMARLSRATPRNVARLQAEFDRALNRAVMARKSAQRKGYETGAFKCNDDRLKCKEACKAKGKKLCGCGLAFGACIVSCVIGRC